MKQALLVIFSLFLVCSLFGQSNTTVTGYIYETKSEKPIPYINIGFLNEQVGTITDEHGRFDLVFNLNSISPNSILQISSIGYKTIKMNATEFFKKIAVDNKFFMTTQPYDLGEVVIKNELRRERNIGFSRIDINTVGYWLNAEALGGEIAMKLPIDKEKTKLHKLVFYINRNNSRVFRLRVNIYDYKNGLPGRNLLKENIFHEVSNKYGMETINLEPYNIIVNDDIVVSLELVKVYGNFIDFEIAGSTYKSHSFTRHLSQDKWNRYPSMGLAMKLSTSFPSPNGKIIAKKRSQPKRLSLFWDTSESMASGDRDLKTELRFIEKYIKALENVDVEAIKFNTHIIGKKVFIIRKGHSDGLMDYLNETSYHGEASFDSILKTNDFNADSFLLFSDGNTIFKPLEQTVYIPTFSINSKKSANHLKLQEVSSYGDGHYINLNDASFNDGMEMIMTEQKDIIDYEKLDLQTSFITGKVISDSLVVPFATVREKNTFNEVLSDSKGNFKINAEIGDVLIVNGLGLYEKVYTITSALNNTINLAPKGQVLDEVTLVAEIKDNNSKVQTSYGVREKNAITYGYSDLEFDSQTDNIQSYDQLFVRLPGVNVTGSNLYKRYTISRNVGTSSNIDIHPIIVIDGMIFRQTNGVDNLPPINFELVKSVRVLKSMVATNKYGSLGAYGVIEIRTSSTATEKNREKKQTVNALAKNNSYVEESIPNLKEVLIKSNDIKDLESSNSLEEAKSRYRSIIENSSINSLSFYVDAFDYFKQLDKEFSVLILSNLAVKANTNTKALKILAYKLEEAGEFNKAQSVLERIMELQPDQAQAYYDLAKIYERTGMYQKSLDLYKLMMANRIENIDFSNMHSMLANEMVRLIALYKSKLDLSGIPNDYLSAKPKIDLRIVFCWNDPKVEFEVQFVNPQSKFFIWSNTIASNKDEMFDQVLNGYSLKEFVIDDSESGEWLINMQTINEEKNSTPTYLKYIVYENYGQPNEKYQIKVIRLETHQQKILLEKLLYK